MLSLYSKEDLCFESVSGEASELPDHAVVASSVKDFSAINENHVNLVIGHWRASPALQARISEVKFDDLPELKVIFPKKFGTPLDQIQSTLARSLLEEFEDMVAAFSTLCPEPKLKLSFTKARDQPCPLFHIDNISLRLICTLKGPGTEWLRNRDVNRKALGKGSNRNVVHEGSLVQAMKAFQVAILKGEKRPKDWKKGLVHRSPPLILGEERWFIELDGCR